MIVLSLAVRPVSRSGDTPWILKVFEFETSGQRFGPPRPPQVFGKNFCNILKCFAISFIDEGLLCDFGLQIFQGAMVLPWIFI